MSLFFTYWSKFVFDILGFKPLIKRWGVERSFSWFENFRRLAKDYKRTCRLLYGVVNKWSVIFAPINILNAEAMLIAALG